MTEPFTPPDLDLTALEYMPLNVGQLLASDTWAISSGDEAKAAVTLWCYAWHQVPAGSVPNDDKILSVRSGAGVRWKKVREVALRGFVLCSDGRLYHRTICEQALVALDKRQRWRRQKSRQRGDVHPNVHADNDGTEGGQRGGNGVTGRDGTGIKDEEDHEIKNHDSAAREPETEFDGVPEAEEPSRKILIRPLRGNGMQPIGSVFVGGKRLKAQDKADAEMRAWLHAKHGMTLQEAAQTVDAARDPTHPEHDVALDLCLKTSRQNTMGWFEHEGRRTA